MISKNFARVLALGLAALVLIAGTGVVLGASSSVNAKAQKAIRVVRENSTTASATSNSTVFSDIPGATVSMNVPATSNGSLLVARFQGHASIIKTSGCIVRILVDATTMEPNGSYAFVGQANVAESVATSGAIERSLAVGTGTYSVKAQLRISTANSVDSQCQLSGWHFAVERHQR